MQLYACYRSLFGDLNVDTLVLTPNLRLSRFIQQQWYLFNREQGRQAWPELNCFAWQHWSVELHRQFALPGRLLTDAQCGLLWRQTVTEVAADEANQESLADYARAAFDRQRQWLVSDSAVDDGSSESQLRQALTIAYRAKLEAGGWLDGPACLQQLGLNLAHAGADMPAAVMVIGFDDEPPLLASLFAAMAEQGVVITRPTLQMPSAVRAGPAQSSEAEILSALRWAKSQVRQAGERAAKLRIGIVIPELARLRPLVERLLMNEFEPGYGYPDVARHAPGFNISAGQPLAQTPLVAAGLNLLSLCRQPLPAADVAELCLSPFFWREVEWSVRVAAAAFIREQHVEVSLAQWRADLATLVGDGDGQAILTQVRGFAERVQQVRANKQSHRQWAQWFHFQLKGMGWPGERTLDTLEFQQYNRWCEVCEDFAQLDQVEQACDLATALSRFSRALYIPFLPQTGDSPVQILGLLEASGLHFDSLWVTGLSDDRWPEPCQPNPLLPTAAQKRLGMPRASIEREFELAEKITRRFSGSALQVHFSWPAWDGDEPKRASTLLASYQVAPLTPWLIDCAPESITAGQALEVRADHFAPRYIPDAEPVRGGSALLKDQAACPFRAFARHRLRAVNPDVKEPGVSPVERGNLIHAALERLWRELGDRAGLLALDDAELERAVERCVQRAWVRLTAGRFGARTEQLEVRRAVRLVSAWLACEKSRSDFTVLHSEQTAQGSLGALTLQTRLDRLDRLSDGSSAVIDYKTGATAVRAWFGERPDEPQVPLYCVLQEGVSAAVFAELSWQAVAARGVSRDPDVWPGLKLPEELSKLTDAQDWQGIVEQWRAVLGDLAGEFLAGAASVSPKSVTTCTFCDLQPLCRIGSAPSVNAPEGDDAAE